MHQKRSSEASHQIGKEPIGNPKKSNLFPSNSLQIHPPSTSTKTHLTIEIPSPKDTNFTHQIPFQNDPIKPLLSTPHKRPKIMIQTPFINPPPSPPPSKHKSNLQSLSSNSVFFPSKKLALRLFNYITCAHFLQLHFRFCLILSLPFFYFFTLSPNGSLLFAFISAFGFSTALVISINLALPRLPSIRSLIARSLSAKICSKFPSSKPVKPVYWSIGSKPKSEKRPNSGSWVQVFSNGDVYEGEFHKGKCSGSGVYYYYMSGRYEGDWVDEKYDGYGVETWARGSRYRGQYKQGLRHGFGVYRFYSGDVYAGEWAAGQSNGCGVHTCEDGSRYVGEFKWGVKHGLGYYHFRNGDTYAGEYFADKMHGFGVYRFGNGHRYEGAWHEGRRQGLGMYTFRSGESQSGHWENGVLNVPTTQNTHPGSPFAVNHSKVLNAVQEARRAAEKAYDVGKVDERVNRAVAAANKAANAARVAAVKAVQKRVHNRNNSNADETV